MENVLNKLEAWTKANNKEELFKSVLIAKIIIHFCSNSPIKNEYEGMIAEMIETSGSMEAFLENFYVENNGDEMTLYLKDEYDPEEEEALGIEPILVGTFKSDIFNELIKSNTIN